MKNPIFFIKKLGSENNCKLQEKGWDAGKARNVYKYFFLISCRTMDYNFGSIMDALLINSLLAYLSMDVPSL